jgi:hypothetical protein
MLQDAIQNSAKLGKKFYCEICDYKCCYKSDLLKHNSTSKHKDATQMLQNATKTRQNSAKLGTPNLHVNSAYNCDCGKEFNHRSSYYRHRKSCLQYQNKVSSSARKLGATYVDNNSNMTNVVNTIDKKELIEMVTEIAVKITEQTNNNVQEIVKNVLPHVNNSTNMNNCHNNVFNINMFLNEKCKNAMNLTDFIESLPVTPKILNDTRENGLTKSLTNMMVDGLNNLDLYERPIHCTDPKRKIMYVKDNDVWEKDNNQNKIISGVSKLAVKQRANINNWQEGNDDWEKDENMQIKFTNLVGKALQLSDQEPKEQNKILKGICSVTYLDDSVKNSNIVDID